MSAAQLETCMQAAWDNGRDPFEDQHVLALLDQHPALLEAAATWRNSVAVLPTVGAPAETPPRSSRRLWPLLVASTTLAASLLTFTAWPSSNAPSTHDTRPTLRVLQTTLTQRIEHHGSACSVHEFNMEVIAPPTAERPYNPMLLSRVAQTTRTSLNH
ncbi:MAG: hypothetical protein ACI89X_001522 [Planctomycetota bacterium]|jgi:hypothetical protein